MIPGKVCSPEAAPHGLLDIGSPLGKRFQESSEFDACGFPTGIGVAKLGGLLG